MKQNTSNIPATGFAANETQTINERKYVTFNMSALFTLSLFSIRQLLFGEHLLNGFSTGNESQDTLFKKLALYSLDTAERKFEELPRLQLDRQEVKWLRIWLEARMKHCEQERDEDERLRKEWVNSNESHNTKPTVRFNPDTYIAQKFLLLDLREWLAGEIGN